MTPIQFLNVPLSPQPECACSFSRQLKIHALCLPLLLLSLSAKGQLVEVIDYFNSYSNPGDETNSLPNVGWKHYNPGHQSPTDGGQLATWTFPANGPGDRAYELFGGPANCPGGLNRGGSYRTEPYTELFYSLDVLGYDPNPFASLFLLGARVTTPGSLQTQGYMVGYSTGSPRQGNQAILI